MDRDIIAYYDALAPDYDARRFGGSYGRYLDRQERAILAGALAGAGARALDIGCGTGRLSDFASAGCDASEASLALARLKHPTKPFTRADIAALPYDEASFDAAFCFHVFMHCDAAGIAAAMRQAAHVLRPGGRLIADVASAKRRRIFRRPSAGWHGAGALDAKGFADLAQAAGLRTVAIKGVMLLPAHRLAERWRMPLCRLDLQLAGLFPDAASYLVGIFEKTPAPA